MHTVFWNLQVEYLPIEYPLEDQKENAVYFAQRVSQVQLDIILLRIADAYDFFQLYHTKKFDPFTCLWIVIKCRLGVWLLVHWMLCKLRILMVTLCFLWRLLSPKRHATVALIYLPCGLYQISLARVLEAILNIRNKGCFWQRGWRIFCCYIVKISLKDFVHTVLMILNCYAVLYPFFSFLFFRKIPPCLWQKWVGLNRWVNLFIFI